MSDWFCPMLLTEFRPTWAVKKCVDDLIQQTNQLLERHRLQQRQEWNVQNDHLKSVVRENKGIWLSSKVFWWAIGVFEVAVCLAIYFGGNALLSAIRWHTNNEKPNWPGKSVGLSTILFEHEGLNYYLPETAFIWTYSTNGTLFF